MFYQSRYNFSTSLLLDYAVEGWHKQHSSLDSKIVDRLKERLNKEGYTKAADSLEPKLCRIYAAMADYKKLRYFASWELKSFKTPPARRMIKYVIRRHSLSNKEFFPDINVVRIDGFYTKYSCYQSFFCLPAEVEELKTQSLNLANELKDSLTKDILRSFSHQETFNLSDPSKK